MASRSMQRRTSYRSLIVAFNLALIAGGTARALTITPTFDSSITSNPQAATIEATIEAVIGTYETMFVNDPVNVSVTFSNMTSGLGENSHFLVTDSYTDFRTKLISSATSSSDNSAITSSVPAGSTNPVNGNANMEMSSVNAAVLGIPVANAPLTATLSLNLSLLNFSRTGTQDSSKYDLFSVVSHEMDEILGLGSAIPNGSNGQSAPTGAVEAEDLFRYGAPGVRSFTTSSSATAYFSINGGTTNIVGFNQNSSSSTDADFGDWASSSTPRVQDAFGTPGSHLNLSSAETTALDVIGWTLLTSVAWNPSGTTAITAPAGPPDAGGTWTNGSGNWWNGTANTTWSNASVENAQFGTAGIGTTPITTPFTVTLGSAITVGTITFANANYTIAPNGFSLTINNGILAVANATVSAPVILGGANSWETVGTATLTATGNISGGFGLTKAGPGTLILSGTNTYSGGTGVSAGTLQITTSASLPSGTNLAMTGGALDIHGQSPTVGNIAFGNGVTETAASIIDSGTTHGTLTLTGNISYTSTVNGGINYFPGATVSANMALSAGTHTLSSSDTSLLTAYDVVISGAMSGAGGLTTAGANSDYALTGANTYSGATVVGNSTLFAAATNSLSPNSAVTINSGAELNLSPNNSQTGVTPGSYSQMIGSLAGAGNVQLGNATLTTGADNTSTTFSGTIFQNANATVTKTGSGTWTISSAAQLQESQTNVNGGTLVVQGVIFGNTTVNNGGTLQAQGFIIGSTATVNSGGTLSGNGQLGQSGETIAVNVLSGGTIQPSLGTSSQFLEDVGTLSLAAGGHYSLQLSGSTQYTQYSLLDVTNGITLGGDLEISLLSGYVPTLNTTFFFLFNGSGTSITTKFSDDVGGIITQSGIEYQVNYNNSGYVSLKVLAIPEPGSWMLMLGGAGFVAGWGRFRRRR